jgi:hypothetical protein
MRVVLFDVAFAFACAITAMLIGLVFDRRNLPTWAAISAAVGLTMLLTIGAFSLGVYLAASH